VQFYFKLPRWFTIPTPIGTYNPDWALVFENDTKIYFVAETKDTGAAKIDVAKLHREEQYKIACGKAHFDALGDVEYRVVKTVSQLIE
jgi:type III restriction enzyme